MLLINYLHQGANLGELFEVAASDDERLRISKLAIEAMAGCHTAGLWQADIHLNNFMVAGGRVYVLDGGDIRSGDARLERKIVLNNLALYFAQFPVSMDIRIPELLKHYSNHGAAISADEQHHLMLRV